MNLAPVLRQRYFDSNGDPLSGGLLYTYIANTTTPLATYTDSTGVTPNANPIVLDTNGEADLWLDPTLSYKFILKNSAGVTQWTTNKVAGSSASGIPTWNANTTYSQGNIVADGSGQGLLYVSLTDDNLNNALTSVANWRVFSGHVRTLTSNTSLAVSDDIIRSNSTSGSLTHTLPANSTTPVGKKVTIKDVGTGGNTTSVRGAGSDTVDGTVTYASVLNANDSITVENNGTTWDVLNLSPFRGTYPTIQRLTTGTSATYTTLAGVKWIRVKLVGGGGGGGGAGGSPTTGTTGGTTNWITSLAATLLSAVGGVGGQAVGTGGTGGAPTVNSPAILVSSCTGQGGAHTPSSASGSGGGWGGSTPIGPGGVGGVSGIGNVASAAANTGGGGGGALLAGATSAGGGGAGAYIEAIITAPGATYTYSVGAKGTGGTGTNGGGDGGTGLIIVEEHYQSG